MKTYYVYIIKCSDQSYYTGITNDIERRLQTHNEGINPDCYTYKRRPVNLMFVEDFSNPIEAIAAEKQIKSWSRKKKEALFQGDWNKIHELAKCKNSTSHVHHEKQPLDSARDDRIGKSGQQR
ncbi:excinuclease ABC subunit C [Candidatus Scalindua japonica]|uniref:Excinuclease ABC subunit C n=1 Tax=Candidatus Scalindua japonica TaxID=1284222 RepID=A0A286TZ22_9BACT|nr:GIY-YIG nuclease family protein [Candidatus Scalindua japonica]GAX61135.1 excinuclease ABC subunit C [Candidatus Scalindua japonica]